MHFQIKKKKLPTHSYFSIPRKLKNSFRNVLHIWMPLMQTGSFGCKTCLYNPPPINRAVEAKNFIRFIKKINEYICPVSTRANRIFYYLDSSSEPKNIKKKGTHEMNREEKSISFWPGSPTRLSFPTFPFFLYLSGIRKHGQSSPDNREQRIFFLSSTIYHSRTNKNRRTRKPNRSG